MASLHNTVRKTLLRSIYTKENACLDILLLRRIWSIVIDFNNMPKMFKNKHLETPEHTVDKWKE